MLRTRQVIPPLTMRTLRGHTVHAWDYKQKKSLVIAFLDSNCALCEEFFEYLTHRANDLAAHNAVVLITLLEQPRIGFAESLPPNMIVGVDISGRSTRAFLGEDAVSSASRTARGVFITDRYGELVALWGAPQHEFPSPEMILTTLRGIEIACEECYMPNWPSDA